MAQSIRPPSAVPAATVLAGITGVLIALGGVLATHPHPMLGMAMLMAACALPMWWLEFKRCGSTQPQANPTSHPDPDGQRHLRLVGGGVIVVMLALSVSIQLHFGGKQIASLHDVVIPLMLGTMLWVGALLLPRSNHTTGSVEALAVAVHNLLRHRRLEPTDRQAVLGWCVKTIFLPLMLGWLHAWLVQLNGELNTGRGWLGIFIAGMAILYALDTLFATIGYLSTHRGIDAHIRSTDATWLGWLSALVCYPPLSAIVLRQWLDYDDGFDWTHWLADRPSLAILWGGAILLLTAIYTSATVVFGPRFSNLTHRGIITSGPFRYTKHPAYISKNLSWWLIATPFVSSQGVAAAALNCMALLGVNAIYWTRARTEERHLMQDPVYRQYAAWIGEHGLQARFLRALHLRPATR